MNEGISAENESSNPSKGAPLDEENRQIAKTGLQELGLPAEHVLKHLISVGEVIVRGNRDFHRTEGMSRHDTPFWGSVANSSQVLRVVTTGGDSGGEDSRHLAPPLTPLLPGDIVPRICASSSPRP
jgi:hypothetical protein